MNREEQYFRWLYSQVGFINNPDPHYGYILLAEQLHKKEFIWTVPNDDNRAEEGRRLRDEFLEQAPLRKNDWFGRSRDVDSWLNEPCSMLELLIVLSRQLAFQTYIDGVTNLAGDWFYQLLENLNIRISDEVYNEHLAHEINDALEVVINRTYSSDGQGGLFPVSNPQKDFRNVELWFQMSSYVLEYSGD